MGKAKNVGKEIMTISTIYFVIDAMDNSSFKLALSKRNYKGIPFSVEIFGIDPISEQIESIEKI